MEIEKIVKIRKIVSVFLIIIILVGVYYAFMERDTLFSNKSYAEFPDGCIETYVNAILVGEECNRTVELAYKYNKYEQNALQKEYEEILKNKTY